MTEPGDNHDQTQPFIWLTPGSTISHFEIIKKIGTGGMGEVYLALDTKLNRQVALKFMLPRYSDDLVNRKRFEWEQRIPASLNHPNIVTIYEIGNVSGRLFTVMEYVEGESLKDVVASRRLNVDDALGLIIQICEGLGAAHASGYVHRDIKPANIVVDRRGVPNILDFGLAEMRDRERLTQPGQMLGTVGYLAPEQIRGTSCDARADLFSVGVVLYELVTGESPFRRNNEYSTLKAILESKAVPLTKFRSDVPDELQRIVSKALNKNPDTRYQTAQSMIDDLKGVPPYKKNGTRHMLALLRRFGVLLGTPIVAILLLFTAMQTIPFECDRRQGQVRTMLAVLPFENLGAADDEYFADGITDEIIGRLASLADLGVISRTSSMLYKNTEKDLTEIAGELGVDYIVEGSIRWNKDAEPNQVRILPKLIRVADNTHLWSAAYQRSLTEVFAVQCDIATQIAEALGVRLLAKERVRLETEPTENIDAYDVYLRGLSSYRYGNTWDDRVSALEMYTRATELDSSFALAYARIAEVNALMFYSYYDRTEERLALAKQAIDRALAIDPDLPEAHVALGLYYYWGFRDYDRARKQFELAQQNIPNLAELRNNIALVQRREGKWEHALANFKGALQLDPLAHGYASNLAETLQRLRRYPEAAEWWDRAIMLAPNWAWPRANKARLQLKWRGDLAEARRTLAEGLAAVGASTLNLELVRWFQIAGQYDSALCQTSIFNVLHNETDEPRDTAHFYAMLGRSYHFMDEPRLQQAYYDSARIYMEKASPAQLAADHKYHSRLSLIYAGLGQKDKAIREAKRAVELLPGARDALAGPTNILVLAEVYALTEEYDQSILLLEELLSIPSPLSMALLRLDPRWDPLRINPRFQDLLSRYDQGHQEY